MRLAQKVLIASMGLKKLFLYKWGSRMCSEKRIDDLMESGTLALKSDFDPTVFRRWRVQAVDCLTTLLGTNHYYTRNFKDFVRQSGRIDLLAAYGILSAVQQLFGDN